MDRAHRARCARAGAVLLVTTGIGPIRQSTDRGAVVPVRREQVRAEGGDLVARYRSGDGFLFATPTRTLLAEGVREPVAAGSSESAAVRARVAHAFERARAAGVRSPMVVGALPFAPDGQPRLWVPERVRHAGARSESGRSPQHGVIRATVVEQRPDAAGYAAAVRDALSRVEHGELEKVVLARAVRLRAAARIDVTRVVQILAARDPAAYVFAVDPLPGAGDRSVLVGASPELLVSTNGRTLRTAPLAGSAPVSADPVEDAVRARALASSEKDRHEHALVVAAISSTLSPLCVRLRVPAEPRLVRTSRMWHLSTPIIGELAAADTTALDVACALHPTPAIGGTPSIAASRAIAEIESFDRGFYAGIVGFTTADGDGEWALTIRSGEIDGADVRLCAGAGIVAGSDPDEEYAETTAKLHTLLDAMGIDDL